MRTRSQIAMGRALKDVSSMAGRDEKLRKAYGSLCHAFPVMIRQNGLCQTLAFFESKRSPGDAFDVMLKHIVGTLPGSTGNMMERIRDCGLQEYLHFTRELLDTWIYYKRFAVSILGVTPDLAESERA